MKEDVGTTNGNTGSLTVKEIASTVDNDNYAQVLVPCIWEMPGYSET